MANFIREFKKFVKELMEYLQALKAFTITMIINLEPNIHCVKGYQRIIDSMVNLPKEFNFK